MSHDVFVSHSSLDKLAADAVCHGLEAKGIRCWIAPRDQIAGRPYGTQITGAIEDAQVMVLVFSDNVNNSQAVLNEINIAAGANVTIVPFRIAKVDFNPELHFYLGRMHWLDAFPQPVDAYIDTLVATIRRNLKDVPAAGPTSEAAATSAAAGAIVPETAAAAPPPAPPPPPPPPPVHVAAPPPAKQDMRPVTIALGVFGVVLLLALIAAVTQHPSPTQDAATNQVEAALSNKIVSSINDSDNDADDDDNDAKPATSAAAGSETVPVRAADQAAVERYETEVVQGGPPASLDGATLISTSQLVASMKDRDSGSTNFWLIDARGCSGEPSIPSAICLSPNTINQLVAKVPNKSTQIVVFCHDGSCPNSYEAASAALQAGYDNVFWYRGGINAWTAAGLPVANGAAQ
jgi:rhodanese-related sulfurtransferase